MSTFVKTNIVEIGDQQAVYIPKLLFDFTNLDTVVELEIKNEQIVIHTSTMAAKEKPVKYLVREKWDEQFQLMSIYNDDQLLDEDDLGTDWDEDDWEWVWDCMLYQKQFVEALIEEHETSP